MSSFASMRSISISNYFVRAILANVNDAGLSADALMQQCGLPPELQHNTQARISAVKFGKLQALVMESLNDEGLGYTPQRYLMGTWGNMCHAVIHCTSLGHALSRFCRFYQMFEFGIQPSLELEGDEARLVFSPGKITSPLQIYAWEHMMFNAHRFASWLVRQHLPLTAAELSYPAPDHAEDYRHLFLGQPVYFNKSRCCLIFHRSLTELPLAQNEQSLRRFLQHPNLVLLIQQYRQMSWSTQVRSILNRNLMDSPSVEDIADRVGLHPQTLRRRLAQEGTTYNDLKTQCRRDTALYLLGKSNLSIEQIALRAGFSETSAFTRAFKGWTGVPPQNYRQRM